MTRPAERSLVFNVVLTGTTFTYLRYFVASQLLHSEARFRLVANGCPPEQIALMDGFARDHPGRVVEVLDVSPDAMVAHGVALDRVRAIRDDGDHFCLIDPDIKANAPFVADFVELLDHHHAVTSGKEVWSEDNHVPDGHPGVAGEHFFDRNGFVFGSPHLSLYQRDALEDTTARWGVGLQSAGPDLSPEAKARLAELGHTYVIYDTAKIVNALLQADGYRLAHSDLTQLVHIGGLAHYLSPSGYRTDERGERAPEWTRWDTMAGRHEVTRFTARTLRCLADGEVAPAVPEGLQPSMRERLHLVRREVIDLLQRHGDAAPPPAAHR